jgi:hypothetical protein
MAWASDNTTVRRSINTPAWLLAGIVAITVNTALLDVAARRGLDTGNGVLLRLIRPWIGPLLNRTGLAHAWLAVGLPGPESHEFLLGFHIFIGMLMALTYGYGERLLTSKPWVKGLVFAILVYAVNAFALLPLLGEGINGSRKLSGIGQAYFAFAHTSFFLILACCYARFTHRSFTTSAACRADARRD